MAMKFTTVTSNDLVWLFRLKTSLIKKFPILFIYRFIEISTFDKLSMKNLRAFVIYSRFSGFYCSWIVNLSMSSPCL